VPIIVSIASEGDPDEFIALARRLDKITAVAALELNISCPNLKMKKLISQERLSYSIRCQTCQKSYRQNAHYKTFAECYGYCPDRPFCPGRRKRRSFAYKYTTGTGD